jgi:hypothetical protein
MNAREFLDGRVILYAGDCRAILPELVENSIDSVVVDPPYHLQSVVKRFGGKDAAPAQYGTDGAFSRASTGFMGRTWDGGDIAFQTELWAEVLRVLKPGGYIFAFSGCCTYHKMACAIEDAGFITHPFFAFAFGSGFPKAHSVSKQLDRAAGAEREVIGKSTRHGGGIPGNGCCYEVNPAVPDITAPATDSAREWDGWFYGTQSLKPALEPIYLGQKPFERGLNGAQNVQKWGTGALNIAACKIPAGYQIETSRNNIPGAMQPGGKEGKGIYTKFSTTARWPANLAHDNSDEVLSCFPDSASTGGDGYKNSMFCGGKPTGGHGLGDSGSAARFFASFPQDDVKRIWYGSKANANDRAGSKHPTVKPIALLQYLVRLITPPGGTCIDFFAGTGTTAEACFREGFRAILIEREEEYIKDIERRMELIMQGPATRTHESAKARGRPRDDGPLFGGKENFREPNLKPSASPRRPYADDTAIWGNRKEFDREAAE